MKKVLIAIGFVVILVLAFSAAFYFIADKAMSSGSLQTINERGFSSGGHNSSSLDGSQAGEFAGFQGNGPGRHGAEVVTASQPADWLDLGRELLIVAGTTLVIFLLARAFRKKRPAMPG